MARLDHAILGLRQALDSPRRHQMWRWLVRHRMAAVRDALLAERTSRREAWLAARAEALHHERDLLLDRVAVLGPEISEAADVEPVRADLLRLVTDLERHRQKLNDLVYDGVALELGGSE